MISPLAIFNLLLYLAAAGLLTASLLGYLGRKCWVFELFSHFRPQYAALAVLCGVIMLLAGQPLGFWLCLGIYLFNLALILPLYRRRRPAAPPERTYRLLSANILGHNALYTSLTRMLTQPGADLVLLVEYRHHHHRGLAGFQQSYPHRHLLPRADNYGLALLSRLPFTSTEVVYLTPDRIPVLLARLELEGRPLTILGCHPTPPKRAEMTRARDQQIHVLAHLAAQQDGEVILMGDLNTTSWSYIFRDCLRDGCLCDSRAGFGVQPTWPDRLPLLRVPIDHILHTPGLRVARRALGPFGGSDHRPVYADFYLDHLSHPETEIQ